MQLAVNYIEGGQLLTSFSQITSDSFNKKEFLSRIYYSVAHISIVNVKKV